MNAKRPKGRPRIGWTRRISLTLPDEVWVEVWNMVGFDPENGTQEKALAGWIRERIMWDLGFDRPTLEQCQALAQHYAKMAVDEIAKEAKR